MRNNSYHFEVFGWFLFKGERRNKKSCQVGTRAVEGLVQMLASETIVASNLFYFISIISKVCAQKSIWMCQGKGCRCRGKGRHVRSANPTHRCTRLLIVAFVWSFYIPTTSSIIGAHTHTFLKLPKFTYHKLLSKHLLRLSLFQKIYYTSFVVRELVSCRNRIPFLFKIRCWVGFQAMPKQGCFLK